MSPSASAAVAVIPTVAGSPPSSHSCSAVYCRLSGTLLIGSPGRGRKVERARRATPQGLAPSTGEGKSNDAHGLAASAHVDREVRARCTHLGGHVGHRDGVAKGGGGCARRDVPDDGASAAVPVTTSYPWR